MTHNPNPKFYPDYITLEEAEKICDLAVLEDAVNRGIIPHKYNKKKERVELIRADVTSVAF